MSSDAAPEHARLKPSVPGDTSSYDLSYIDNGEHYGYAGTRKPVTDQYVLYFDASRQAFVLDRVESTFDMNVTRIPGNSDPTNLGKKYPHLETKSKQSAPVGSEPAKRKPAPKSRVKSPLLNAHRTKPEKKAAPKHQNHSLAFPEPSKQPPRKPKNDEEEEEEEGDGDLLIEYPDAAKISRRDFSPAFPSVRRFDDFMDRRESEADDGDADGESDEEVFEDLKLPSPLGQREASRQEPASPAGAAAREEADDGMEADFENDLEKDLEMAFEGLDNSRQGSGDESEISEED